MESYDFHDIATGWEILAARPILPLSVMDRPRALR
jgi:hypothetical protein